MGISNIRALLVVQDRVAVDTLTSLLRGQGVDVTCVSNAAEAMARLPEQPPDLIFADFDDSGSAASVLEVVRPANGAASLLSVLLLQDESERAAGLRLGAHFIVYKPVSLSQVRSVLLATKSLMSRERRRTTRVPIQIPVSLSWDNAENVEGILLDVSETGMDVLISRPVDNFADLGFRFALPERLAAVNGRGVVAWSRSTGETGVRFENLSEEAHQALNLWLDSSQQISPEKEAASGVLCKLTDLSLGACYVESESPFPMGTRLDLILQARGTFAAAGGSVRVLHPGYGMGIEFLSETGEQRAAVEGFLDFLVSQPGVVPELRCIPRDFIPLDQMASTSSTGDALLDLVRGETDINQADFLAELQKQRGGPVQAAAADPAVESPETAATATA
jgi:CheY-like chemotaxis protein